MKTLMMVLIAAQDIAAQVASIAQNMKQRPRVVGCGRFNREATADRAQPSSRHTSR
jgi:hypothetical protein